MESVVFSGFVLIFTLSIKVPALKNVFPIIRVYLEKSIAGRLKSPVYASLKSSSLLMTTHGFSSSLQLFLKSKGLSSSYEPPNAVLKNSDNAE